MNFEAMSIQSTLHKLASATHCKNPLVILVISLLGSLEVRAQDPSLPPTDIGLANVYDGIIGKAKFIYQGFSQAYEPKKLYDDRGNDTHSGLKIGSVLVMNQFIYMTPVKVLGGELGFTTLVPVVKISSSNLDGQAPSVNPGVLGDIIAGAAIQWSDRKLFQKSFFHRAEIDITMPSGTYDTRYAVNASARLWTFSTYHAFTLLLTDKISISARNHFNYNTHIIGTQVKPGAFYNGNYSIDYSLCKTLKIEAAAYYVTQFNQDSFDGNSHYYQDNYGLTTTKEHVLGYGPGLAYFAPGGVLVEVKTFFEADAQNRFSGSRPTLRLAIPLDK
jgi:hypothetical protein